MEIIFLNNNLLGSSCIRSFIQDPRETDKLQTSWRNIHKDKQRELQHGKNLMCLYSIFKGKHYDTVGS